MQIKELFDADVTNSKSLVDGIIALSNDLGWEYPKVAYYNVEPKVTLVYRDRDIRKFAALKELAKTNSKISFKYPSTVILTNCTSPNQIQKMIIAKLCNMTPQQYKSLTISNCKSFISYNKVDCDKEIELDNAKEYFDIQETENLVLFNIHPDAFSLLN